jgi:hypothetical protein
MVKNKKNQLEFKKLSEPQFTFFSKIKVKKEIKFLRGLLSLKRIH